MTTQALTMRQLPASWRVVSRDIGAWFFGVAGVLTLCVSIPATYAFLEPFHNDGTSAGVTLSIFAVIVFEVGAVGAKLITLAVPEWRGRLNVLTLVLLLVTSLANYAHGVDLFSHATLASTLAQVRQAGGAPAAAIGAAALFPTLLYVWLTAFVARCKRLATQHTKRASERDAVVTQLRQEADALATQQQYLTTERDALQHERDALATRVRQMVSERDALRHERDAVLMQEAERATQLRQIEAERAALGMQLRQALADLDASRVTLLPAPDAEDLLVGGRSYSLRQIASVFETSEGTVRRKLKSLE